MTTDTSKPEEIIIRAVWAFCIRTGKPATAKDIAAEIGKSDTWVRKHWTHVGGRDGIVCCDAFVEVREKNYGTRVADRRVDALRPKWEAMAARLREIGGAA